MDSFLIRAWCGNCRNVKVGWVEGGFGQRHGLECRHVQNEAKSVCEHWTPRKKTFIAALKEARNEHGVNRTAPADLFEQTKG